MRNLLAGLLFAAACSSAYADQVAVPAPPGPRIAIDVAPAKLRAPYDVQIIRESGETLPTYALKDRFYVQGTAGERYTIHVTNPTAQRVEAVISVDGLDAVDGEAGDLRKRGYIIEPYGDVRVEGFRTSLQDVATFRFSSVDGSYAAGKGKARNVGVIAVAIFEENAPPPALTMPYRYEDDLDARERMGAGTTSGAGTADAAKDESRGPAPSRAKRAPAPAVASAPSGGARRPAPKSESSADERWLPPSPEPTPAPATHRQGLGTEFGETRYSSVSYTRFERAAGRPIAVAELRYNDAGGLVALGIQVQPLPDSGEIMLRETADPFPGDHFAQPVR